MENNNFHIYLEELYEKKKFDPIVYVPYPQRDEFDDFIENLRYCSFFNKIPISEWEKNIIKIFKWAKQYYSPAIFERGIEKTRPSVIRNKHTKIFKDTQKLLETFMPNERRRITTDMGTTYVDYEGIPNTNLSFIEGLHKQLGQAITDIDKQKFEIFPKEYYQGSKQGELKELRKLLRSIAQEYNISPYSDDIEMLLQEI